MSGAAVNLSRLSRGIGEVKTNGHERVNVVLEPEDYFNYALQRSILRPVEPLYQLSDSPELSPRPSLLHDVHHKNFALPKTFTTRKGALLLFSEEFANKNHEEEEKELHHRQQHDVLEDVDRFDLKTVDDFAKSIMAYGSCSGMSLIVKTVDSPRRFRPGFSARRYLSKLTRVYGDTFLDKLVTKGYINEKNIYEQNPVLPRLRHRINDDVSYPPAPYRILKSMLRGPGFLSGYTFHLIRMEEMEPVEETGRGDLSTVVEDDEDKSTSVTTTKSRKIKSSTTVIKLKEKDTTESTSYTDLSHDDKGNVLTDLLVKSTISYALEKQRKILLAEEEAIKEAADRQSVSQKSEDYNLNLAEAVRSYLESQVDENVAGKTLRGAKLSEHSSRSYEATENSGTITAITDGESVHQRNWPETLGEKEYIGDLPIASLREVVSSSTSGVSSRRSSVDKSPSVVGMSYRQMQHINLSPIAGSREVTFKDAASPVLQLPEGDSWRGHYREEKFSKVSIIPPIGGKASSPKAVRGKLQAGGEAEMRRGGQAMATDQAASNMPTLGRMRGKALSTISGGSRSQTSVHSARSDGTEGGVKGSVLFAPDGQIISIGGSITPSRDTESISAVSEANRKEADVVITAIQSEVSEEEEPVWDLKLPDTASTSKAASSSRTDTKGDNITQRLHTSNNVSPPLETHNSEQQNEMGAKLKQADVDLKHEGTYLKQSDVHSKQTDADLMQMDDHSKKTDAKVNQTDVNLKQMDVHSESSDVYLKQTDISVKETDVDLMQIDIHIRQTDSDMKTRDGDLVNTVVQIKNADVHMKDTDVDVKNTVADVKNADADLKPTEADTSIKTGSLMASRRGSHGSTAQPTSEQELVKALTEHAHKIATTILARPGTGQDLVNDAQVAAEMYFAPSVLAPSTIHSREGSPPKEAMIEEFLATAGVSVGGSDSDDEYKDKLRERLSSVVSKMSGDSVPANAIVSAQLVDALLKQDFNPADIELVQSETGQSILQVKGDGSQQPGINELMGGVKPGHLYQVPARKGRGSTGQEKAASPLGPIDIVGYGEAEMLHTDEIVETREKEPPTSYISAVLEEARAESISPAKSAGGKSQVSFKGLSERDILEDGTSPSQDIESETTEGKMAGEAVSGLGAETPQGVEKGASAKSTTSAKSAQGVSALGTRSSKSTPSSKSTRSGESGKVTKSGRARENVSGLAGKARTKSMMGDRDEFVVGKVSDNKELEALYGPVETPVREQSSVLQGMKSVDKLKMSEKLKAPGVPAQSKKGVSKKRGKPAKGKKAKRTSMTKETSGVVSKDETEKGEAEMSETEKEPRVESVKTTEGTMDLSSELSHTPTGDVSEEMEFIIIRDEFSDTDEDADDISEEERKRIAEEKLQESLRAAKERRRQAELRGEEPEPEEPEEDTSRIPPEMARELRAAKRAAEANKRRELVEKKRREREEHARLAKEEAERQEQLARELEEERRKRDEERRMRKQQREEAEREEEERDRERQRQLAYAAERERRQKEEYQKRLEIMRRKQAEADRQRKEAEEARRMAAEEEARLESIKLSEMAEEERLEYLRCKKIEAEERRLAEEIERIKREEDARVALEEAKKLAEEMARQQAELERRLQFNRGLQIESNGLEHTQDVTRAFVFSYFELLQWLGIDISDIELLKMTKF